MKNVIILCLLILAYPPTTGAAEFRLGDFETLKQQCSTPANAPWRTIPWQVSLLQAQGIAAEEKKPLFIWAMDGHPLGCT